jgi:type II secretory pathway pseudopilin PulG
VRNTSHRRGLTILEVVASLAMLGGVASGVLGAVSFMSRTTERDRVRLAAYEAAHRLILQYLDDAKSVYRKTDPVVVSGISFRFAFSAAELTASEDSMSPGGTSSVEVRSAKARTGMPSSPQELEQLLKTQLEQVTVRVWLEEPRAGYRAGEPIAELVRVYDITRDMDRLMKMLLDAVSTTRDNQ